LLAGSKNDKVQQLVAKEVSEKRQGEDSIECRNATPFLDLFDPDSGDYGAYNGMR